MLSSYLSGLAVTCAVNSDTDIPRSSGNEPMHTSEPHSATQRTTREFQPTQLTIPGAGISPQIRQSQADVEASALANYMAQRAPGRSLGSQLQRALANASVRQPNLF